MIEITKKTKVSKLFQASSASNPYPLITLPSFNKAGYQVIEYYHEIENLTLLNQVTSLAQIPFPTFPLEASDSERTLRLLDLQWKSARVHFNLYLNDGTASNHLIKTYSVLSPEPYPYANIDLGNFPLGSNCNLVGAIQNVGYGLLQGNDKLYANGDLISHYYLEKISEGTKVVHEITNQVTQILPSSSLRTAITILNSSTYVVYLDVVNTLSLTSYMVKLFPNSYYELTIGVTNAIFALHDGQDDISIQIREFT